jgi:cellobiose phosphorylase
MASYGHFDDARREYVITNPRTPVKWINYIGTLGFGGFVDHTGGLLVCKDDPSLNRITKYLPQLPAADFKGSTIYLRIERPEGGYRVFSPFYTPCLAPYERFECHVGLGYSRWITVFDGIHTEIVTFVPAGEQRVIQDIRVTNLTGEALAIDCIPVVEFTHFNALAQFTNADWVPQTMQSWSVPDGDHTVLAHCAFMQRGRQENYFTANRPASSFETDRKVFLGDNEYGSWANPLGLQREALTNSEALRGDNIAALLCPLGVLEPGAKARLITQLGQAPDVAAALPGIRAYRAGSAVDEALAALGRFWEGYLSAIQVETPVASLNSMLNVHNPRQCHTTKNWSRYLSLYQLGLGSRGIGFRDSAQDSLGVMAHMPEEARDLVTMLLHIQLRDGSARHQLNPLTMEGQIGDAAEDPDRLHYYSDDHLWAVLAVCAYLKETGDFAYLDHVVPYYEKDRAGQPLESGTVRDHLRRGIAFTRANVGAHGLPLLGYADWNDTINLLPGAESLFTANLYGRALLELIGLFEQRGDTAAAEECRGYYAEMRERVNSQAWDGAWYVRYFDPQGQPLGSHANKTGQIFTNGQSWPVLSGFATPERARMARDSVRDRLNPRCGIKLSAPGFNGYDPVVGGVSTYPPGAKENGGIFLHANPWVIIAETLLGEGDRAFEYYNQINPAAQNDRIDVYECEPYVYAQNILGDEHPQFGLARNSWLSGTASWMYQAGTQYLLGVRAEYDGLRIDPCIPRAWDGFQMRRRYRGATYAIRVSNPGHVSRGVVSLTVDGQPIAGNIAPIFADGGLHTVEVVLG